MRNPLTTGSYDLHAQDFIDNVNYVSKIATFQFTQKAIVLAIDRRGGMFPITKPGAANANDTYSSPFTIRCRLLTNYFNESDGTQPWNIESDEIYAIPEGSINNMDLPEPGEIVLIQFDKPFDNSNNWTAYWIARQNTFATRDYHNTFKSTDADETYNITHDQSVIWSGNRPAVIDWDYDIQPNPDYEPYPQVRRFKSGDVFQMGKSNTMVLHTFNAYKEDDEDSDKRGMILIETELDYIHNTIPLTSFNDDIASDDEVNQFRDIQTEHVKHYLDAFRKTSRWEVLNSLGVRAIFATKFNVDRRLIHKDTEKDGRGTYGNVQKLYDPQFRDDGPGVEVTDDEEDRNQCGQEILKGPITKELDFNQTQSDITKVFCDQRDPIDFDKALATIMFEAEQINLITRNGKDICHAVLAEPLARFMQETILILYHMIRTSDIHRDRTNKLAVDFEKHRHAVVPGQTLEPLGSPFIGQGSLLKSFLWYDNTTQGDVGSDSGDFDEKGSDSISMKIKDRIQEERDRLEALVKEIPQWMSTTVRVN